MTRARALAAAAAAGLIGVTAAAAQADSVADFYKGKRMTMIVGYSPGGGYDTYTRLMSRHMTNYIPGKPNIIVRNMPGAGSIVAAQYIGSKAPKDGTVIGTFDRALPLNTMLGLIKIPFDPFKMTWLGSMSSFKDEAFIFVARTDSPYKSIKDLMDKSLPPIIFSATAPGSTGYDVPYLLSKVVGLRIKIVAGYPGSKQGALAVDRGEAMGRAQGLSSIRSTQPHWIKDKKVRFLLQTGRITRHPDYPDLPTGRELAKNKEDLALINLLETPLFMYRPYAGPAGIPADRAKALQAAFVKTGNDPAFIQEGHKLKLDISPLDADGLGKILQSLKDTPPQVLTRYKEIMDSRPPVPMVEHTGPVVETKRAGRRVYITHKGKKVMARVSGSGTKVTIDGKKAKRKAIKTGMTCTFTYPSAGSQAKSVACKK
ncbi:MAG: tripartite tricarboxylate transporter substrate-binding protein [Alphaproteobacteria bacterium]|nr:tripartite tricarboxylate transporter substrate-binding protein [Alphaproteobacteria bacterium]